MPTTAGDLALGQFLRVRRNALLPEDVDVASYGARRVPGLRREEVALLAGVSASYYTRIEQGTAGAVSGSVLRTLADALRLDPDDRAQLYRLAGAVPDRDALAAPAALLPSLAVVVDALTDVPAGVLGRDLRMLAWNRWAHRVFAPHLPYETPWSPEGLNWAEALLLDPVLRDHFANWEAMAHDAVGRLRAATARHPDDVALAAVVARLVGESPVFARFWDAHPARERPLGGTVVAHPDLGRLELCDTVLRSVEDEDQLLVVFHWQPGSPTAEAFRRASW